MPAEYERRQAATVEFQADRASSGMWWNQVRLSLQSLHDHQALRYFISVDCPKSDVPMDELVNESWFIQEKAKLAEFWEIGFQMAAARCWSQVLFTTCVPNCCAAILHKNRHLAQQHLELVHKTWDAVLLAENMSHESSELSKSTERKTKEALKTLLLHLGWNKLQISREILGTGVAEGWKLTIGGQLEHICHSLFAHPANTKHDLEDCFAHLASVAKLSTMATPLGKYLGLGLHIF